MSQNHRPATPNPEDVAEVIALLEREISQSPPTFGLVGVSGVGKSSTINQLFGTSQAVSHTVACTKEFTDIDVELRFRQSNLPSTPVPLRIIDAPGLGEDIARDPDYLAMYEQHLERCDVILWVMSARNRAVALDQIYLRQLARFHDRMVFAINQVDIVEPMDWSGRFNIPSRAQEANIEAIRADRGARLERVVGRPVTPVCYSSQRGYNLELLFKTLLEACPQRRRWIYSGLKTFDWSAGLPPFVAQMARIVARA